MHTLAGRWVAAPTRFARAEFRYHACLGKIFSKRMADTDSRSPCFIFLVFLRLGLTSFGGPAAHLGYFRAEFVTRRRWLDEHSYADLVALCQFLPGPASSQVGMALGLARAGYPGAFAAWAGFTLPAALALILFALGMAHGARLLPAGLVHGLQIVAVAVVAHAVSGMARTLCTDAPRIAIMLGAAAIALLLPTAWGQAGTIAAAGLAGRLLFRLAPRAAHDALAVPVGRDAGLRWLALFLLLLAGLPLAARWLPGQALASVDAFYRAGALVFGGGHVVLPLLQAEVVARGWVSSADFLAGYAAAQAVPGPLFAFAAFLGAAMHGTPSGWAGGLLCLLAIFAPAFLLVAGALPFWARWRGAPGMGAALAGINAAVVGLLLAALCHLLGSGAVATPADAALALAALAGLMYWKLPPWLVIAAGGAAGVLAGWLPGLAL